MADKKIDLKAWEKENNITHYHTKVEYFTDKDGNIKKDAKGNNMIKSTERMGVRKDGKLVKAPMQYKSNK